MIAKSLHRYKISDLQADSPKIHEFMQTIDGQFLGILLKACSVPHLPRTEPNYPQSYPQFRWKITLGPLKITCEGSVCRNYGIRPCA